MTPTDTTTCEQADHDSSSLKGVVAATSDRTEQAERIAAALNLPVLAAVELEPQTTGLFLVLDTTRVTLVDRSQKQGGVLAVDFLHGAIAHRKRAGQGKRQLIGRAIGLKYGVTDVVDTTAGLGADAFVLASMGCRVLAIERHPAIAALLQDGLHRAKLSLQEDFAAAAKRIELVISDAKDVLTTRFENDQPSVIYLDPMYPHRTKSALGKQALRVCRSIVGDDLDAGELLQLAREVATRRIVVKRPRRAKPIAPDIWLRFEGKSVRYDVYQPKK